MSEYYDDDDGDEDGKETIVDMLLHDRIPVAEESARTEETKPM